MSDVLGDFAGRLPACGNLLDLGCGAGEPFACEFPRRGWDVTGVDFSARMLELATRAYTGQDRFDGHITFMGRELYYSHVTRPELDAQLVAAGFSVIEARERSIGGETFLWVTSGVSG